MGPTLLGALIAVLKNKCMEIYTATKYACLYDQCNTCAWTDLNVSEDFDQGLAESCAQYVDSFLQW